MSGDQQPGTNPEENTVEESVTTEGDITQEVPAVEEEPHDEAHEQLQKLEAELDEAKDQAIRAAAEVQNIRRRAEKDVESARRYALEKFAQELLPVIDNLDRALDTADTSQEAVQSIVEGVELTRKSFIDVLAKFNVEQVSPEGEPFDPQLHEAMSMIENKEVEPNTVLNVVQKGYTLNGRLIRAAMVVVSR